MRGSSPVLLAGSAGDVPDGPPSFTTIALDWHADPILILILGGTAALYLLGVFRLRRRGDTWSTGRTISFLLGGVGVIAAATLSGLASYDETLFSAHMVQHMLLSMVAPVFLALGAPITLALRTLPRRVRAGLLAVLHSRPARVLCHPIVGFVVFVGSPFALYFSGWYPATLDSPILHDLMHLHFVLAGCLFFWPILGIDPLPARPGYPLRMLVVFLALPFHAILGLTIMSTTTLIAAEHYLGLDLTWVNPVADQHLGGGLLWATGDLIGLLFLVVLFTQWSRADAREAVRADRHLDRIDRTSPTTPDSVRRS